MNKGKRMKALRKATLGCAGALGLLAFPAGIDHALAQDKITLVYVGYGGATGEAVKKLWLEPFMQEYPNIEVIYETGVQWAKLAAMEETGNVTWDLYEGDLYSTEPQNFFEKIDCSVVPCDEIIEDTNRTDYTMVEQIVANGIAYNKEAFGDHPPKTWKDFLDTKAFPGVRAIPARPTSATSILLGIMDGLGIPRDQMVPYKTVEAIAALRKLKDEGNLIFFREGPQCPQFLRDQEAVMAGQCDAPAIVAANEDGANLGYAWDSVMQLATSIAVVKGTKHPKEAMQLMAYILDKDNNAKLSSMVPRAPVNKLAVDKVDPKYKDWTVAGHRDLKPLQYDWNYIRKDGRAINEAYEKFFSGN